MRNAKGITLIALVITIIVLLILAGIAIATLAGENGILTQAERAARETRGAELDEYVNLAISEATLDHGNDVTLEHVENILREDGIIDDDKVVWEGNGTTGWLIDKEENIIIEVTINPKTNTEILYPDNIDEFERISVTTSKTLNENEVIITLEISSNIESSQKTVTGNGINETFTGNKTLTTIVTENGTYTFTVTDESGNSREVMVVVNEFLKLSDLSSIQISQNPTDITKDNVIVTIDYDVRAGSAIEYRDGTNGSWNNASNPQTVEVSSNNTSIYARYNNGTETAKEISITVSNIDKEAPNSFILATSNITTSSITVSGETTDAGSGIEGYGFGIAKQGESVLWTSISSNTTHIFNNLEQNTNYTVVAKAVDKVGLEKQTPIVNVTTEEVIGAEGNITMIPNITMPTNQNVQVTISTTTNLAIQYQVDSIDGLWEDYTSPVTMTKNGIIYARLVNEEGQTNNTTESLNISNIDKEAPNSFSVTATDRTTSSITVSGETTDVGSGIAGYKFGIVEHGESNIQWTDTTSNTTYTFNNLNQNTSYTIVAKAIDKVGLERQTPNLNVKTREVTGAEGNVIMTPNITAMTNQNVEVTISTTTELIIQYQKDGTSGLWVNYTSPVTMTENGVIYARLVDNTGQTNNTTATLNILNIDKVAPNSFSLVSTNRTTGSITVSGSTTDVGSGIAGYKFGIVEHGESTIEWTDITSNTTHTFNNLVQNTSYTIVAKAIDKVGLERQTPNLNVATREVIGAEGNVTMTPNIATATNQNIQVTMSTTTSLIMQYQIGGTSGLWVNYTSPVTMTANGVIYARLINHLGQTNNTTISLNILNIDKVAPNSFSLTTSDIQTTSFRVSGSTTDTGSLNTAAQHIGISRYEVRLLSSTNVVLRDWTTIGTATTYNFTGLADGTVYKVNMRAVDKAGNIRVVANGNSIITTKVALKGDGNWDGEVNNPKLGTGMIPVAWNSGNTEFTPTTDEEWYDYKDTTSTGANTSKWANAKTSDGSYWVWIPRYEYKITYTNSSDKSQGGNIDINFIPTTKVTPTSGYKIHPAFEDGSDTNYINGEWDKELSGIWVMKYEASQNGSKPKSVPGVVSWRGNEIGKVYTYSQAFDSTKGSHLIKNSEWGAVAYLTHSEYGKNGVEVTINLNSNYYTGGGTANSYKTNVNQSTTGNVTGIYDLSGNAHEYVAGYIPNGTSELLTYGSPMITVDTEGADISGYLSYSTKYVTAYPYDRDRDTESRNYYSYAVLYSDKYGYGDAILETSTRGEDTTSWNKDYSYNPHYVTPFFLRSGYYGDDQGAGLFYFAFTSGMGSANASFRAVLAF